MNDRSRALVQQIVTALLFVAALALLGWLSTRHTLQVDWTAGHRNTLTDASRKQLDSMPDPIAFKVFLYPRSEQRQGLEADIGRYQRFKSNITVDFIDPSTHPQQVKDYNVSHAGEVIVEYQGRRESLTGSTEAAITTALQRIAIAGERFVVFLEGHHERSINDSEPGGYSRFAQELRDKGLKVQALNFATNAKVPDNASVLVIASPAKALLAGEEKLVDEYVARGGNLLWLTDPDQKPGLDDLAKTLGITWQNGTAILLDSAALGLPPFVYVTTQYPPNPVTKDFQENALFPLVRSLGFKPDAGWNVQPLLTTTDQAWLESGKLEGDLKFDEGKDVKGPLTIGVTAMRDVKADKAAGDKGETRPQRVAAIGDSDFLSNGYYNQLGNSLLGLNLIQWLASREAQLNVDVPKAPDRSIELPAWGLYVIYATFPALLPLGLLGFGVTRWFVRRRR